MTSRRLERIGAHLLLLLFLGGILFPIYWMLSTSVKLPSEYAASPPVYWPSQISTDNFKTSFARHLSPGLANSFITAAGSTLLALAIGVPAGFGLARSRSKGRKDLGFWILSLRMFPPVVTAIPLFLIFSNLRLVDTRLGLILIHASMNLPLIIWLMMGYFQEVPEELEESAQVDGCTRLQSLLRISFPLAAPGVVAAATFSYIFSWNEFMFALIFGRSNAVTMPPVIAGLHASWGIDWGGIFALSLIITAPVIILALAIQRYMIKGLTFGALKG